MTNLGLSICVSGYYDTENIKQALNGAENGLPDIRWHDLRTTYCTLLLKEVLPDPESENRFKEELLEIVPDVSQFLPDIA